MSYFYPFSLNAEQTTVNSSTLSDGFAEHKGIFLPRGMRIPVELRTPIDTRYSEEGDLITVQVPAEVYNGDYMIIPAYSFLHGSIAEIIEPGRGFKKAKVHVKFHSITLWDKNGGRRIPLVANVLPKEILKESAPVDLGGMPYKTEALMAKGLGAATGLVGTYAFVEFVEPFATFGISNMLHGAMMLLGGLAGFIIGGALVKQPEIRVEPGTKMNVFLEEEALVAFSKEHQYERNRITKELRKFELSELDDDNYKLYENLTELKSEELKL